MGESHSRPTVSPWSTFSPIRNGESLVLISWEIVFSYKANICFALHTQEAGFRRHSAPTSVTCSDRSYVQKLPSRWLALDVIQICLREFLVLVKYPSNMLQSPKCQFLHSNYRRPISKREKSLGQLYLSVKLGSYFKGYDSLNRVVTVISISQGCGVSLVYLPPAYQIRKRARPRSNFRGSKYLRSIKLANSRSALAISFLFRNGKSSKLHLW